MSKIVDAEALSQSPIKPGYWLVRVHLRSPLVPAAIWWCEHEPEAPENRMDRGHWAASIGGESVDPFEVIAAKWHEPIDEAEYRFRLSERAWAQSWAPEDPAAAHPRRRIDLTGMRPIEPC
jgi:hypothetical protein